MIGDLCPVIIEIPIIRTGPHLSALLLFLPRLMCYVLCVIVLLFDICVSVLALFPEHAHRSYNIYKLLRYIIYGIYIYIYIYIPKEHI